MAVTEFETDDVLGELGRKFANVSLEHSNSEDIYKEIMLEDLYESIEVLKHSTDYHHCHKAIKCIRRYLTQEITVDRIQNVFDLGVQDRILQILRSSGYEELKYETAWIITNLAYGTKEQTASLIHSGVIDALVNSFRSTNNFRLKSQSAWALANVSIDSPEYRESMAKDNIIGDLALALSQKCDILYNKLSSTINPEQIQQDHDGQIICQSKTDSDDIKDLTWSLANMCRGGFKTAEHWEQYLLAFNALTHCIFFENVNIWTEACWGLSRILSNMFNNEFFYGHLNLNPRLCPRLVSLIRNQSMKSVLPALQTISNFSSGPNKYIKTLLDADLLNNLWWYMSEDTYPQLRRNAMLTIANIAAGDEQIVKNVVYNENIIESVILHISIPGCIYDEDEAKWTPMSKMSRSKTKEEWKILKEALWVLSNIFALANDHCICTLLNNHPTLIKYPSAILRFSQLPLPICLKTVDVLISLLDRINKISVTQASQYAEEMMKGGIINCLNDHCSDNQSPELSEQVELLYTALTSTYSFNVGQAAGLANKFGLSEYGIQLPSPKSRRIVQGFEDGDVRFIENAFNNIQL